jgi:hypothetical protein
MVQGYHQWTLPVEEINTTNSRQDHVIKLLTIRTVEATALAVHEGAMGNFIFN